MTSSLVGSEMCIRDSTSSVGRHCHGCLAGSPTRALPKRHWARRCGASIGCLLYTSDAADDM
eukprot:4796901-Prorocentrum_lima.AAC.1